MKPYKPQWIVYVLLMLAMVAITAGSLYIPDGKIMPIGGGNFLTGAQLFSIVAGIGGGGFISVVIAWLIDIANCRRANQEYREKYDLIFGNYHRHIQDLCWNIAANVQEFVKDGEKLTFEEWIRVLSIPEDNLKSTTELSSKMRLQHELIIAFTRLIKEDIELLNRQYPTLVGSGMVITDAVQEHMKKQWRNCTIILDIGYGKNHDLILYTAINKQIIVLVEEYRKFFPESKISKCYDISTLG